jgi:copper chaperone CopZ
MVLANACSNGDSASQKDENAIDVTYTETAAEGTDRYVATLAIEGMACEMMCGNKIAGTLNGLDGVINTEIEFEGEGEINSAVVEFDHNMLSEKEMIEAVQALAGGAYKVRAVNVVHHKVAQNQDDVIEEKDDADKIGSYGQIPDYRIPNIFSVFSQLF